MQLAFDFGDERWLPRGGAEKSRYAPNIFYAVMPDMDAATRIDGLAHRFCREHRLRGRPLGVARYHVSLYGLQPPAWAEADLIAFMRELAEPISARGFAVRFDQALGFSPDAKSHPFVLSSTDHLPALSALQEALDLRMKAAGFRGTGPYNPHVTMLYDAQMPAPVAITPIQWSVREFVLVRRQDPPGYERLGCWPLR